MPFTDGVTEIKASELNKSVESHDGTTNQRLLKGWFTPGGATPAWNGDGGVTIARTAAGLYTGTFDGAFTTIHGFIAAVNEATPATAKDRDVRVLTCSETEFTLNIFVISTGADTDDVDAITLFVAGLV